MALGRHGLKRRCCFAKQWNAGGWIGNRGAGLRRLIHGFLPICFLKRILVLVWTAAATTLT
jgi:hypothetical protein